MRQTVTDLKRCACEVMKTRLSWRREFSCSCMSITEFVQLLFASNYYAWPDRVSPADRTVGRLTR